jgi:cysteinyl-tRNA synthetase
MPDALTRVTEYVEEIVDYVKTIVHKGMAYESNGSVYMDIGALRGGAHDYPKLEPSKGKATQAEMEESEGAHTAEAGEKRNPADFALWKKSKGGEPSWASPWGGGRPGWHIECSVMASDLMGDGMDVHAGGSDLKFPHHDNELAQAEAYHGCCQWVNYFLHFGHLHIKGLKMSKSLKNFVTIRQALATHSARQIRLMFLLQPWDKQMNYSDQTIEEAEKRETSFKSYFAEVKDQLRKNWLGKPTKWDARSRELAARLAEHQSAVHECLCDNFNTPGAMAALLAIVSDANSYVTKNSAVDALLLKKGATYVTRILRIFGVATQEDFGFPVGAEGAGGYEEHVAPVVSAMVAFRDEVRAAAKGTPALMKACDELRDEKLVELGVRVEDRADGARWTLDDPATLRQEQAAKKAKEAETRVQKLLNKLGDKAKDIAKVEAAMVPAEEFLRRPPHAAKYAPDSYDEQGKPSKDAAGGALSKSMVKEVEKLHKKQVEAYAKQKAQLDAKPGLLGEMEAALAAMQAEARAVVADKATMAVLSEEVVAQLEASMGAAETSGAAGASAEEDWRKKEAEELKAKQAAEAKKAAEKAKAEEEAAAKAAALEAAGKKVAGGLHKFDASEVDVNGGSATADDFMDAFGF